MSRALILAHHDHDGLIDPHVVDTLQVYRRLVDRLVVVSTSAQSLPLVLVDSVDDFITRPNEGYDFCSWKVGLDRLRPCDRYDEIICCNDSVYGPLFNRENLLSDTRVATADVWGMVRSVQGTKRRGDVDCPHLQSWFFVMRKAAICSPAFATFWNSVRPLASKEDIIDQFEIGLSETFAAAGLNIQAVYDMTANCSAPVPARGDLYPHVSLRWSGIRQLWRLLKKSRRDRVNPSELLPMRLLISGVPFLKVGVFRVNHYGLNLAVIRQQLAELQQIGRIDYDLALIETHLRRLAVAGG
jgi:lipopolysaccharide biosynthesis protein